MVPWRAYSCADGEAAIIGGPIRHWLKAAEMFEQPALLEGPLADMGGRMREREKLEALITPWLARQPKRELRSEEHTSELQSLMRISYAVFCLKKKTN